MKQRILIVIVLAFLAVNCSAISSFAYDYYGHYDIEITEVPYKPVHAFFDINLMSSSSLFGGSIGLTSARPSDIQFESYVGYRSISTIEGNASSAVGSFDIMVGGTFFPRKPNLALFGMPVRLKASLLGGIGMAGEGMLFTACTSLALVFSSGDDPNGMSIGIVYWPSTTIADNKIPSTICASIGFMFAPLN